MVYSFFVVQRHQCSVEFQSLLDPRRVVIHAERPVTAQRHKSLQHTLCVAVVKYDKAHLVVSYEVCFKILQCAIDGACAREAIAPNAGVRQ